MFELKPISQEAIPAALEKANRFRLLNEPIEAESICLDILKIDSGNQEALIILLKALTDQFDRRLIPAFKQAYEFLAQIRDEYSRLYYHGVICERRAKACLRRGGPGFGHLCYDWFYEAMQWFERAEAIRPPGDDNAILRWNTCARILDRNPEIGPAPYDKVEQMLE